MQNKKLSANVALHSIVTKLKLKSFVHALTMMPPEDLEEFRSRSVNCNMEEMRKVKKAKAWQGTTKPSSDESRQGNKRLDKRGANGRDQRAKYDEYTPPNTNK